MPELTPEQIVLISRYIKKQEITFSHLPDELIDHLCCNVEDEMLNGSPFSEAFKRVKSKISSSRLKEIQKETLYAVDKKYRKMKNLMKISGVIGTIMLGFAALFKIQHWPGAGIIITSGAFTLSFIFLPSALTVLWKESQSKNRLLLFISAFLAGLFFTMGALFKIQHWPGSGLILTLALTSGILVFIPAFLTRLLRDPDNKPMLPVIIAGAAGIIFYATGMLFKIQHWPLSGIIMLTGMILLGFVAFPWYTWLKWKDESHIIPDFLFLLIGSLIIIVPGTLINLNLHHQYEDGFYSHLDQQRALYNYLYEKNQSVVTGYRDSLNYQQIEQLHSRTLGLLSLIGTIQTKMVQESEGDSGMQAAIENQIIQTGAGPEIQYHLLSKPFHQTVVREFLLTGSNTRLELQTALKDYRKFLEGNDTGGNLKPAAQLLESSVNLPGEVPVDASLSLLSELHSLEVLKNTLLAVEYSALKVIARDK